MQNYLFAFRTEALLYEAVHGAVGDPVANKNVGAYLRDNLVRQPVTVPFSDRLEAMAPGKGVEPLRAYLNVPLPSPPVAADAAEADTTPAG